MGWFTEDTPVRVEIVPPTLDEQLAQADRDAELAIDGFLRAATKLEIAAERADAVAAESQRLADEHAKRAEAADESAAANRARAARIRGLLD